MTTKKLVYKKMLLSLGVIGVSTTAFSQEPSTSIVNEGVLAVSTGDVVSFEGTFENTTQGTVINDGTVLYYQDFINQGYYGLTLAKKSAKAIFVTETPERVKHIHGDALSSFYDITFDSATKVMAFDLGNNIDVYGTAEFQKGIVKVDSLPNTATGLARGMISFQHEAKEKLARDEAHIEGQVEKIGNEAFTFPIGDQGFYRPARIATPKNSQDTFTGQYVFNDQMFFETHANVEEIQIKEINSKEYWLIEKGNQTTSDIVLTLSWDERTTPLNLLESGSDLRIVRWDPTIQMWVNEGGVIDRESKEITTVTTVRGYGYFTLATAINLDSGDRDIIVYNLVTPNGDGKNDYFRIDNIQVYPKNKVEIYNRWGTRVFETQNYDPQGDGSENVFRGYSDGKTTVHKGSMLPSGTYYYVITYEFHDERGSRMLKKAAYLHLETE